MLRWVFLLLLLANALLFFWYAQAYRFADDGSRTDFKPSVLRTPTELSPSDRLQPRPRECGAYHPLAGEFEAQKLVEMLERYAIQANTESMPQVMTGLRLELPLPADADARIRILDNLALIGWVPETRDGALVLGEYSSESDLVATKNTLPEDIAQRTQTREVLAPARDYKVSVSYLVGYEIGSEINQLILDSWPGIKFEKNPCEKVASLGVDQ